MELSDHDESAEYSFNDYKPMLELVESAIMEGEFDINELVSNNLSEFELIVFLLTRLRTGTQKKQKFSKIFILTHQFM